MNNQPPQNIEPQYYQEDEIDLKQLIRSLADRKWFIFGFTGLVTVLAIAFMYMIGNFIKVDFQSYVNFDSMLIVITDLIDRIANRPTE